MRKLLYILLLSPAVLSLGHDVYFYTQNQERGFMVSDLGWLWDKYHKESHDQWKMQVTEFGKNLEYIEGQVSAVTGTDTAQDAAVLLPSSEDKQILPQYAQEITVDSGVNTETKVTQVDGVEAQKAAVAAEGQTPKLVQGIGFLLQQKAVLVFGGLAFLIFCLDLLLRGLFSLGARSSSKYAPPKGSKKGDSYKYGRK